MSSSSESSTLCRSCMTRLHQEPMDHDNVVNKQKLFYVYSTSKGFPHNKHSITFAATPVSTKTTRVMALQKFDLRDPPLTDKNIIPVRSDELNNFTVFVTVKSRVYCVGGLKGKSPTNEVWMFDTNKREFDLESCSGMILPRWNPGVVSVSGIIYVFGGIYVYGGEGENRRRFPWAEFLDTNVPKEEQVWKAMKEPVFRVDSELFATTYDARTILIGGFDIKHGILYNVEDGSSVRYDFLSEYPFYGRIKNPVNIGDKTIYWIHHEDLIAYDLEKHTCCTGWLRKVLSKNVFHDTTTNGPVLVHLNDNLFCCFTLFCRWDLKDSYSTRTTGIVECTRFLLNKDERGDLQLDFVGYESYRCDPISQLSGAVSIEGSFGGLNKQP